MTRRPNISAQTRVALKALLERPLDWHYGYELMKRAGIASGTLYPMLIRLCDQGNLEAKWIPSQQDGRPPRHAYRLTPSGISLARTIALSDASTEEPCRGLAL